MKVGDLVTYWYQGARKDIVHVGLVVETGKYTGNCDVKGSWMGKRKAEGRTEARQHLSLVDDALTTS